MLCGGKNAALRLLQVVGNDHALSKTPTEQQHYNEQNQRCEPRFAGLLDGCEDKFRIPEPAGFGDIECHRQECAFSFVQNERLSRFWIVKHLLNERAGLRSPAGQRR